MADVFKDDMELQDHLQVLERWEASLSGRTSHFKKPKEVPLEVRYRREYEMSISSYGNPTVNMILNKLPDLRDALADSVLKQIGNFEAPETVDELYRMIIDTQVDFE